MSPPERVFAAAAAAITLGNFAFALGSQTEGFTFSVPYVQGLAVPARILAFFFLETSLSSAFGFLFRFLSDAKVEFLSGFGILLWLVIGAGSALVSYFNITAFLMGPPPYTLTELISLALLAVLAWGWGMFLSCYTGRQSGPQISESTRRWPQSHWACRSC